MWEYKSGVPWPNRPPDRASLAVPKPSSRHTTVADSRFHLSSQMVPHSPFFNTSTRPSPTMAPPRRRTNGCWREKMRRQSLWELKIELWSFQKRMNLGGGLKPGLFPSLSWGSRLGGFLFMERSINVVFSLTSLDKLEVFSFTSKHISPRLIWHTGISIHKVKARHHNVWAWS